LILLRQHLPGARILLLGLLPREEFADAPLRRAAAQVNKLISDCADGEHIVYAEIGDVLLDSDGWLGTALSPDWLHFNESGYALLASGLEEAEPSLLAGLLVDAQGQRLTPSHAVKKGRRYRYYTSAALITATGRDGVQNWRLAAREIEECVIGILIDAL